MASSSSSDKRPRGGKRCVAGGPNQVSCDNSQHTDGISIHIFPSETKDPQRRRKWVNFVRKHRPSFNASGTSFLCSAHFNDSCYNMNVKLAKTIGIKRILKEDAIPTVDVAGNVLPAVENQSERKRRQIIRRSKSCKTSNVDDPTTSSTYTSQFGLVEDSDTDSETMANVSLTQSEFASSCTSCQRLKKKVKALQKTISWYKKKKADLSRKVNNLQTESMTKKSSVVGSPSSDDHVMATEVGMNASSDGEKDDTDDETVMDYSSVEESSQGAVETEEEETRNTINVDEGTSPYNEPKFLVFYSCLINLFGMFCFNCKAEKPKVQVKQKGSMAIVVQTCNTCSVEKIIWKSQPLVLGQHPAGNIMTSFAILMSGINISQVMLMFRHMNLVSISTRTYFAHQSKFLFPAVLKHWEVYQSHLIESLSGSESQTWSGDGRFDSMGHSAKYGVYTMFNNTTSKLVHFELLVLNYLY